LILDEKGKGWLRKTLSRVSSLKNQKVRRLLRLALEIKEDTSGCNRRKLEVVIDKARSEIGEEEVTKKERERSSMQWQLLFENPGFNHLGLEKIVKKEKVTSVVPSSFRDRAPEIVYKYVEDIRRQVLNYKDVLKETVDKEEDEIVCECEGSKWKHEELGHVCTGDLKIVEDGELRKILEKGPKYRTRRKLDWEKVWTEVLRDLGKVAEDWSRKEGVDEGTLRGWKTEVEEEVRRKIERLKTQGLEDEGETVLESEKGKRELESLQKKYVLVSADKSENNVIVVGRRFYVRRIREELRSVDERGRRTYEEEEKEEDDVIEEQVEQMKKFGLEVEEELKKLATLYWTAKMHYDPPRARYIAASRKCVLKVLS
jgi:hypothetical protein